MKLKRGVKFFQDCTENEIMIGKCKYENDDILTLAIGENKIQAPIEIRGDLARGLFYMAVR